MLLLVLLLLLPRVLSIVPPARENASMYQRSKHNNKRVNNMHTACIHNALKLLLLTCTNSCPILIIRVLL
jgi:hypothetical protein